MLRRLKSYAPPTFPVTGGLLMRKGFAPGPDLGALLSRLEAAWIDSEFTLTRDELVALAGRL
jgi:poly(A) polymerase